MGKCNEREKAGVEGILPIWALGARGRAIPPNTAPGTRWVVIYLPVTHRRPCPLAGEPLDRTREKLKHVMKHIIHTLLYIHIHILYI